ncbi:UbiD family decarboxylase [Chloroflexota bacterium]
MAYYDLREWLEQVEAAGELKRISGASWDLEMANIAEIVFRQGREPKPAIMFDDIPDYPKGYRTLFGLLRSPLRIAKALCLPEDQLDYATMLPNLRKKLRDRGLIPPKFVTEGAIEANTLTGDKVDLFKFPSPRSHEQDGGRYIGTCHAVIQKDIDTGWVNLGTYRIMIVDRNHLVLHALEGQHGSIIAEKYFARGKVMPVAIAIGIDPALYWASGTSKLPIGTSEYDYAGGLKGEPIEVLEGPFTGLPIPATAEIVIEGECHPGELADEGPFGEWHGYYANLGLISVPEPVIQVKAIHYRDNPILTCAHPAVPPNDVSLQMCLALSAQMWNQMEANGIPGIKGVWCHELGCGNLFNVVSIEQSYEGHSRKAGLTAAVYPPVAGRYTVVVDEDIDPSNLVQVIWAMSTRVLPDQSIQIINRCASSSADPAISPEEKKKYKTAPKPLHASRVLIDACRPLEWKNDWYPMARISQEYQEEILKKWNTILAELI